MRVWKSIMLKIHELNYLQNEPKELTRSWIAGTFNTYFQYFFVIITSSDKIFYYFTEGITFRTISLF